MKDNYHNQPHNSENQEKKFKNNPFSNAQQNPQEGITNIKSKNEKQQKVEYIPYSTIIRIEEPYKDISYGNLGEQ